MYNGISIIMQFINTFLILILRKYLIIANVNKSPKMERSENISRGGRMIK
jgi:hypothetical protein